MIQEAGIYGKTAATKRPGEVARIVGVVFATPELDDPNLPDDYRKGTLHLAYEAEFVDGERIFIPVRYAGEKGGYWGFCPLPENFDSPPIMAGNENQS